MSFRSAKDGFRFDFGNFDDVIKNVFPMRSTKKEFQIYFENVDNIRKKVRYVKVRSSCTIWENGLRSTKKID